LASGSASSPGIKDGTINGIAEVPEIGQESPHGWEGKGNIIGEDIIKNSVPVRL
jgi:hypothetical protein